MAEHYSSTSSIPSITKEGGRDREKEGWREEGKERGREEGRRRET